jgi:hypothetical protein
VAVGPSHSVRYADYLRVTFEGRFWPGVVDQLPRKLPSDDCSRLILGSEGLHALIANIALRSDGLYAVSPSPTTRRNDPVISDGLHSLRSCVFLDRIVVNRTLMS